MFEGNFKFEYSDYMYSIFIKRTAFAHEEKIYIILYDIDACALKICSSIPQILYGVRFY